MRFQTPSRAEAPPDPRLRQRSGQPRKREGSTGGGTRPVWASTGRAPSWVVRSSGCGLLFFDLAERGFRLRHVSFAIGAHDVEYLFEQWISQGIKNLIALLAIDHHVLGAQHREMLGDVRLL